MKTITRATLYLSLVLGLLTFAACGGGDGGSGNEASDTSDVSTSESDGGSSKKLTIVETPGENWGTLKGTVKFEGSAPDPVTAPRDSKCGIKAGQSLNRIKVNKEKGIVKNALVYLDGVKKAIKSELPSKNITIDQEKCLFVPNWTYVLRKNGQVTVKNSDPEMHNFRYRGSSGFTSGNENQPSGAKPIELSMNSSEWVSFVCNMHPWMVGLMRVSEHHAVARTGEDGSFSFDVAPGDYTLVVNHPEMNKPLKKKVTVPEGETAEANASVTFK